MTDDYVNVLLIILLVIVGYIGFIIFKSNEEEGIKELKEYNKKHNTRFKSLGEMQRHIDEKEEQKKLKEENRLERERKKEDQRKVKEGNREKERFTESVPSGVGLTANIARLKKLYKSGTLTKAEFEKAKNNLLK